MVDEVGQEQAERRGADGPAVDEQHVGAGADGSASNLAGAHVEEAVGFTPKEVGGVGGVHRGSLLVASRSGRMCSDNCKPYS